MLRQFLHREIWPACRLGSGSSVQCTTRREDFKRQEASNATREDRTYKEEEVNFRHEFHIYLNLMISTFDEFL